MSTRIGWAAGLDGDSTADRARNADDFRLLNLSWRAVSLCHHASLTDLATGRVRNLAGPHFLSHRAGRVRNFLGDRFAGPRAGRVWNLLGNRLAGPRAGRVRHLLGDRFAGPRAGRVRHLLGDRLLLVADAGVWDLLHAGDRDSAADRVGLLAVTNFLHHPSAAYRSHFGARHPPSAANRASRLAAAGAGGRATRVAGRGA